MWKDWRILAQNIINKWWKISKWSNYYHLNFIDKNYKAHEPVNLQQIIYFQKWDRQARIEVYENWINFDIRKMRKDWTYYNIDRNDDDLIERYKLTKYQKISILWAVSFVIWLWYKFTEDKIIETEKNDEKSQSLIEAEITETEDWLETYEVQGAIQKSLF